MLFDVYKEAIKINEKDALALSAIGGIHSLEDNLDLAVQVPMKKAVKARQWPRRSPLRPWYALSTQGKDWGKAAQCFEEDHFVGGGECSGSLVHWPSVYEIQGKIDKAPSAQRKSKGHWAIKIWDLLCRQLQ